MFKHILPLVLALAANAALAQAWPTKPVRVVVAFAPGGSPEQFAKLYRDAYEKYGKLVKELNIKID